MNINKLLTFAISIIVFSCTNNPSKKIAQSHPLDQDKIGKVTSIKSIKTAIDFKGLYRYKNVLSFYMDTIAWDKRKNFYVKIDSAAFFKIYQDPKIKEYLGGDPLSEDLDFYYSSQQNNRGLKEITVLSQREGEYCDRIMYMIYDKTGKLISSFMVAGSCGDGGYYAKNYGKFLNDSTYVLYSEDNYDNKDLDKMNKVSYTKTITIIKPDGNIANRIVPIKSMPKL